jgi:hypothetical protein
VVVADRARHVPARPELELLRPFEFWDIHKLAALTNVNLSEYIWVRGFGPGCRQAGRARDLRHPAGAVLRVRAAGDARQGVVQGLLREAGRRRATTSVFLFLMMMSLPIKMLRAWIFNLKYIVAIPEFFFNI